MSAVSHSSETLLWFVSAYWVMSAVSHSTDSLLWFVALPLCGGTLSPVPRYSSSPSTDQSTYNKRQGLHQQNLYVLLPTCTWLCKFLIKHHGHGTNTCKYKQPLDLYPGRGTNTCKYKQLLDLHTNTCKYKQSLGLHHGRGTNMCKYKQLLDLHHGQGVDIRSFPFLVLSESVHSSLQRLSKLLNLGIVGQDLFIKWSYIVTFNDQLKHFEMQTYIWMYLLSQ